MPTISERLADLAGGAFLQTASVTAVEPCAPGFVRVELRADAFRGASWFPGTKVPGEIKGKAYRAQGRTGLD